MPSTLPVPRYQFLSWHQARVVTRIRLLIVLFVLFVLDLSRYPGPPVAQLIWSRAFIACIGPILLGARTSLAARRTKCSKAHTELRRRQMQIRHVGQWNVSWTGIGCEECHSAYGWRMDLAARHRETSCRVCGNSGVLQVLCLPSMKSISLWHDESGSSLVRCTRETELGGSGVTQRYKDPCHVSRTRCGITSLWPHPYFHTAYAEEHHLDQGKYPDLAPLPTLNTAALISACLIKHSPMFHPPTGPHLTSTRFPSRFHRPCKLLLVVSSVSVPVHFRPPADHYRSSTLRLLLVGVAPWRCWRHTWAAEVLPAAPTFIHAFIAW